MKSFAKPLVALAVAILIVPVSVDAATVVRTGDTVSVTDGQRVDGNFYALSNSLALSGPVNGDVVAASLGSMSINAPVAHDVLLLGGSVGVNASVTEDVRVIAGDVTIADSVGGSVFVVGGRVKILSTATVAGDVLVVAGEAIIEGTVTGQVLGRAERVRIDGAIAGLDMDVFELTLGDRARVAGTVAYTSENDLVRDPGAIVEGDITKSAVAPDEPTSYRDAAMMFLVSLFASLSLLLVGRRIVVRYARVATENVAKSSLVGFSMLVTIPIAIIVLMVSVLGLFLGLISLALFALMVFLALPLLNIVAGGLVARTFIQTTEVNVLSVTLGALLVQAMLFVPILGAVTLFLLFLTAIGGLGLSTYQLVRRTP